METKIRIHDYVYIDTVQANFGSTLNLEIEFKLYVTAVSDTHFWYKLYATAKNVGTATVNFSNNRVDNWFGSYDLYDADVYANFLNGTIATNETISISSTVSGKIPFNQTIKTYCKVTCGYSITNTETFCFVPSKPIYYNGTQVNSVYYNGTQANSITYNGTPL